MTIPVLLGAIVSGIVGTICTRASKGFTRWRYGAAAIGGYALATIAMAWLVQRLPVGVVYATWSGCATVALLLVDRWWFDVRLRRTQVLGVAATLAGVALLARSLT